MKAMKEPFLYTMHSALSLPSSSDSLSITTWSTLLLLIAFDEDGFLTAFEAAGFVVFTALPFTGTFFLGGDLDLDRAGVFALEDIVFFPAGLVLTVLDGVALREEADLSDLVPCAVFFYGLVVLPGDLDLAGDFARFFCIF